MEKYNVYIFISCILTILVGILVPYSPATSYFALFSVMFAFAYLNPNFELILFVIPVKVKWLAFFYVAIFALNFIGGSLAIKLYIIAAFTNFFLFFGRDIKDAAKARKRRQVFEKERQTFEEEPFHTCASCDITDKTHPHMSFRFRGGSTMGSPQFGMRMQGCGRLSFTIVFGTVMFGM